MELTVQSLSTKIPTTNEFNQSVVDLASQDPVHKREEYSNDIL